MARILLVDTPETGPPTAAEIRKMLPEHRVFTKGTGEGAVDWFLKEPAAADLILTSLALPGIDGAELYSEIREIPAGERVPFVFMITDDGQRRDLPLVVRPLRTSESRSILKPFDRVTLELFVLSALKEPEGRWNRHLDALSEK